MDETLKKAHSIALKEANKAPRELFYEQYIETFEQVLKEFAHLKKERRKWKSVTIIEFFKFIFNKTTKKEISGEPEFDCYGVMFTDGTRAAMKSQWRGPYSEVTPDIDADCPELWIFS